MSEFSGDYAEGSVRSGLRGEIVGCGGDRGEGWGRGGSRSWRIYDSPRNIQIGITMDNQGVEILRGPILTRYQFNTTTEVAPHRR